MEQNGFGTYFLAALPGIFLFVMNWACFINNMCGKKWVSLVPPLGAVWIAVVCLLSPMKPLALIGLADPWWWLLADALFHGAFSEQPPETDTEKDDDNNSDT